MALRTEAMLIRLGRLRCIIEGGFNFKVHLAPVREDTVASGSVGGANHLHGQEALPCFNDILANRTTLS